MVVLCFVVVFRCNDWLVMGGEAVENVEYRRIVIYSTSSPPLAECETSIELHRMYIRDELCWDCGKMYGYMHM
jgi:hypothetical protein